MAMKAVKNSKLKIVKGAGENNFASEAVEIFIHEALSAISAKGKFFVAVSGGHTPLGFFEHMAHNAKAKSLAWDKIELFWVDERCVSIDSDANNYKLAADTFLPEVPIPDSNIHRIAGENPDYNNAASQYEEKIRQVFGLGPGEMPQFDLIILGMGPDGHIGSLLPDSYALFNTENLACVVYRIEGEYNRITLTHPVLCNASHLLIMIAGQEKADIVKEVLHGEPDEVKYPVHTLWPILEKVTWLIDNEAAALL